MIIVIVMLITSCLIVTVSIACKLMGCWHVVVMLFRPFRQCSANLSARAEGGRGSETVLPRKC